MSLEVKAPAVGESVTEMIVGQWFKSEGDAVALDEPMVELESDKATLEVPAPHAGVLAKILKQSGETAEVGEVLALMESAGAANRAKSDSAEKAPPKAQAVKSAKTAPPQPDTEPEPEPELEPQPERAPAASAADEERHDALDEEQTVQGPTGVGATPAPTAPVAPEPDAKRDTTERAPKPVKAQPPAAPDSSSHAGDAPRDEERRPLSPLRRRIAERLVSAQHNAALLTTFNEVDMSAVKQLRSEAGEAFEKKHGVRLGFMSFFVKATISALQQFPGLNAMIDGDEVVYRHFCDIGVAVSTPKGLVVPVLRNAERMGFADIERSINDLAGRARDGELRVEELQGGTFTITNGGVFGSLLSTPIVNPPQSGVLGMHAIQDRPVAMSGQVVIRPMMYVALTYDHRLVDGREAVTFLKQVAEAVENPARLVLDV